MRWCDLSADVVMQALSLPINPMDEEREEGRARYALTIQRRVYGIEIITHLLYASNVFSE